MAEASSTQPCPLDGSVTFSSQTSWCREDKQVMLSLLTSSSKRVQNKGKGKDREPLSGAHPRLTPLLLALGQHSPDSKRGFAASFPCYVVLCCFPEGKSSNSCRFPFSVLPPPTLQITAFLKIASFSSLVGLLV